MQHRSEKFGRGKGGESNGRELRCGFGLRFAHAPPPSPPPSFLRASQLGPLPDPALVPGRDALFFFGISSGARTPGVPIPVPRIELPLSPSRAPPPPLLLSPSPPPPPRRMDWAQARSALLESAWGVGAGGLTIRASGCIVLASKIGTRLPPPPSKAAPEAEPGSEPGAKAAACLAAAARSGLRAHSAYTSAAGRWSISCRVRPSAEALVTLPAAVSSGRYADAKVSDVRTVGHRSVTTTPGPLGLGLRP
mmetsp:Transcript_51996/g.118490  ORF Transcript_51996/g.118490 Transcript_51996/m.118490 type:complete len:250 (+) Transcript_51996:150-899(+)